MGSCQSSSKRKKHNNNKYPKKFKFYHGTTEDCAKKIAKNGFKKSLSGNLGPGVYVGRKEKASEYCQGAIIHLLIYVKNPKFQKTNNGWNDDRWLKQGHDACRVDHASSKNPEWVVKDPKQITFLRWEKA